jgi:signal transduction histidine kinase
MKAINATYPNRIKFIFLASALVLLLLSIFSYERLKQQKTSSEYVERAYQVKLKLKEAYAALKEAEAVQSAYLLTQDSAFLQQFLTSISTIPKTISELDSLIVHSEQGGNLKEFTQLLQSRIARLNSVIDSVQNLNGVQLYAFLIESKEISDRTRATIARMEQREDRLLKQRIEDKQDQERKGSLFILLFSLFSLSILVYSFFKLRRETNLRSQSEYTAAMLEEKVAERTAEIRDINETLRNKNLELERKNEELRSFTYIASHDLKEPLRKISMFTDRIVETENEKLSPPGKKYLERIEAAIRRMQSLIDSVFSYAQTETVHEYQATDLNEVAEQTVDILDEAIEEKDAEVKYNNLPQLYTIPGQMEQLFINLISNSLKYSKPDVKPSIEITSEKKIKRLNGDTLPSEGWEIRFKDNGIGFDEQYKEKIFQIFQRLHGNEEYSGTGIGLAICKKIVENHNGTITASSSPGEGATFTVFIPENNKPSIEPALNE